MERKQIILRKIVVRPASQHDHALDCSTGISSKNIMRSCGCMQKNFINGFMQCYDTFLNENSCSCR